MQSLAVLRTDGDPFSDSWLADLYRPEERKIGILRQGLRLFPHNAIAWAELSLLHARDGKKNKAERCMKVAVSLAPDDRFVIRSAVRCFSHLREPEVGLDFINRTDRTKEDPWLLAAHIALSQSLKLNQRYAKTAKLLAESGRHSTWNLSELNAALGSLLHHEGLDKKANKHFRACLSKPTENALCQVIVDQRTPAFQKLIHEIHPTHNFESETRTHYGELNLDQALKSARAWLLDEPFSARPALFGSFVASVALEDNQAAVELLNQGLKPNPTNPLLLNNKALSLARLGETDTAAETIRRARDCSDGDSEIDTILTATEGLIHFRRGETAEGRIKYQAAIEQARRGGRMEQVAMALVFLAREELDASTGESDRLVQQAESMVAKLPQHQLDIRIALARLQMAAEESKKSAGPKRS